MQAKFHASARACAWNRLSDSGVPWNGERLEPPLETLLPEQELLEIALLVRHWSDAVRENRVVHLRGCFAGLTACAIVGVPGLAHGHDPREPQHPRQGAKSAC